MAFKSGLEHDDLGPLCDNMEVETATSCDDGTKFKSAWAPNGLASFENNSDLTRKFLVDLRVTYLCKIVNISSD